MKKSIIIFVFITAALCPAETVIVDADATGDFDNRGYTMGSESNAVGQWNIGVGLTYTFNNFFIFSIPEFQDDITDVQLVLELTGYMSDDPSEDLRISGVSTPADQLVGFHSGSTWIYDDLMDGPELGVLTVNSGTLMPFSFLSSVNNDGKGPLFTCSLNETGLQMVNDAAGGTFAIGLSMMDIDSTGDEFVIFFKGDGDPDYWVHQLHITTIPEPATMLLLMGGVVFLRTKQG